MESLNNCESRHPVIDIRCNRKDGKGHPGCHSWYLDPNIEMHGLHWDDNGKYASCIISIPLHLIDNSQNFSRSTPIDTESEYFKALVKSMKDDGFRGCVDITVTEESQFPYRSIAGHTRIEAARAAGLIEIPCEILSTKSQTEADILTLLENLLRRDPTPADYATAFHILRDRLVTEKGMRAKSAIAYLADRCGISVQRVETLIRIKENLIPELFRAFEGVGGLPLTVTEASCYAGKSPDEQKEEYLAWRAVGGRKTPRAEPLEDNRPVQPRQSVSRIREAIAHYQARVTEAEFKWGESFAADVAIINVLKWVLSTRKDLP